MGEDGWDETLRREERERVIYSADGVELDSWASATAMVEDDREPVAWRGRRWKRSL